MKQHHIDYINKLENLLHILSKNKNSTEVDFYNISSNLLDKDFEYTNLMNWWHVFMNDDLDNYMNHEETLTCLKKCINAAKNLFSEE